MQNKSLYQLEIEAKHERKEARSKKWTEETDRFLHSRQWTLAKKVFFTYFEKKCVNCGSTETIHLDHIYPRVKDNQGARWLDITNFQPLCENCNCVIKGTNSTDYRESASKTRARDLKFIFETAFVKKGLSTRWLMWEDKKKQKSKEIGTANGKSRKEWQHKIKRCIRNGMSYEEIVTHFDLTFATPDFKYIDGRIKYFLSGQYIDVKARKKEKQKRNIFINKRKTKAWNLLNELYNKRNELSHEKLINTIELMVDGINQ